MIGGTKGHLLLGVSLALICDIWMAQTVWASPQSPPMPFSSVSSSFEKDQQFSLVFSDEFDAEHLDDTRWVRCYWWANDLCTNSGNKELQLYSRKNVSLSEGLLRLKADYDVLKNRSGRMFPFSSGMVTTGILYDEKPSPSRFSFRYGHLEVRAKAPRGKGLWSALWLLPERLVSRPEFDLMEVLGDSPSRLRMHMHDKDEDGKPKSWGQDRVGADLSQDWHTYSLDWSPSAIVWYLDGTEQWRIDDRTLIPDEKLYFLANLAVGGEWPGAPDAQTRFPAEFLIDYVRIWQWVKAVP